jgi:hypothetical protein
MVRRRVSNPARAIAREASMPACPAPMTMAAYLIGA